MFGNARNRFYNHNHICGCYFIISHERRYLPQVQLKSHTTITPISFTTQLTQTFNNPNSEKLAQVRYTFPLYDGVCVNGYTITYGDKTLKGIVQQKDVAKKTFQAAVERGEAAGLLESLPAGVFGVTLGNVPPGIDIIVEIEYCGELKHDASVDGLRYNLPTSIAPRYGSYPGKMMESNTTAKGGISITVDVSTGKLPIRKIQSPSHPIGVTMGGMSTSHKDADFSPFQASATLAQGTAELAGDFVLQVVVDKIDEPQAILESHSTRQGHRAIMTTLVPKFTLPSAHPEIIFIADQSGSMSGSKNDSLVAALKVFIKSLPFGVRFNICGFGSSFQYLWPKSQAYNEENANAALSFVSGFTASYGGTEILQPIEAAFERRLKDLSLEVMLLTDGEIWGEDQVFSFINKQIRDKGVDARVFALGIGQDVSHSLVEGVARAGNGFCQFVTQNEDTDQKVIRMLKGALYAHTKDYSLEINYGTEDTEDENHDFEIVEKVNDCLVIRDDLSTPSSTIKSKIRSFFDTSADVDKAGDGDKTEHYAHLPPLSPPKIIQAPANIPPLFPFNRTTVYLLLGPDTPQKRISSVTLRAKSQHGPLELTIPVQTPSTGTSIHQLAARAAVQDLEEGRGWLQAATAVPGKSGKLVLAKEKYASRFDELVEREAVRLGIEFQVVGKFTSFVAVEDRSNSMENSKVSEGSAALGTEKSDSLPKMKKMATAHRQASAQGMFCHETPTFPLQAHNHGGLFGSNNTVAQSKRSSASGFGSYVSPPPGSGLFGSQQSQPAAISPFGASYVPTDGLFGGAIALQRNEKPAWGASNGVFGHSQPQTGVSFGQPSPVTTFPMPQDYPRSGSSSVFNLPAAASFGTAGLFGDARSNAGSRSLGGSTTSTFASAFGMPQANAQVPAFTHPGGIGTLQDRNSTGAVSGTACSSFGSGSLLFGGNIDAVPSADSCTAAYGRSQQAVAPATSASSTLVDSSGEDEEAIDFDEDMGFALFDDACMPAATRAMATRGASRMSAPAPRSALMSIGGQGADKKETSSRARKAAPGSGPVPPPPAPSATAFQQTALPSRRSNAGSGLHQIINLQSFSGAWTWSSDFLQATGVKSEIEQAQIHHDSGVAATALAIACLEKTFAAKKDVWEMVISKARAWLVQQLDGDESKAEDVIAAAKGML